MPSVTGSDTEFESDSGLPRTKKQKNKPLMERRRRARINRSLSQLKQILIEDEHKNTSQHSKWEKADILEMAVEYLEQLRSQKTATSPAPVAPRKELVLAAAPPPPPPHHPVPMLPYHVMQQYMAYHQLAHLSMYSSMVSGVPGLPSGFVIPPFGSQPKGRSQSGDV